MMAVGDLNADGIVDFVIILSETSSSVSVLLGRGGGVFEEAQVLSTGSRPMAVAVTDLNGDGLQDLLVANRDSNDISVRLGNGDGTFGPEARFGVKGSRWHGGG